MDEHFLAFSTDVSGLCQFWRKGGGGYTLDVNDAQVFSSAEASRIARTTKATHNFRIIRKELAMESTMTVVVMQRVLSNGT